METTDTKSAKDIHSEARDKLGDFLLAEYAHMCESLLRNEESGEKRAAFFVTLVGAAGAILGFVFGEETPIVSRDHIPLAAAIVGAVLLCLGFLTVRRLITRDIETDKIKFALGTLRTLFLTKTEAAMLPNAFYAPYTKPTPRSVKVFGIAKGGWLQTVAFINALLMFIVVFTAIFVRSWGVNEAILKTIAVALALAGGVIVWIVQLTYARSAYSKSYAELAEAEDHATPTTIL